MKHFELSEFACGQGECEYCGGDNDTDPTWMRVMDRVRESAACPIIITSGCRCDERNSLVGGSPTSSHLIRDDRQVAACDVSTPDSHTRFLILRAAIEHGITRIGVGPDFLHLDGDENKPSRLVWVY